MSTESRNLPEENFGALQGCLVEGDPEQEARQRRVRRRSLGLSVLMQAGILIVVVLVPLFAKSERIAFAVVTPVPPYSPYRAARTNDRSTQGTNIPNPCHVCFTPERQPAIGRHTSAIEGDPTPPRIEGPSTGNTGDPTAVAIFDLRVHKPIPPEKPVDAPRTLRLTSIDPAMLRHRIEPVYPILARQTHREGRVEIHAIIGEDGTMQSLKAVGGDPLFYASALEAVQQWIYKPTILNGKPVRVDTTITVIYTMQH